MRAVRKEMRIMESKLEVPYGHIAMGLSGWILFVALTNHYTLVLAILLSALTVPRFVRGSRDAADRLITMELQQPVVPSKRVERALTQKEQLLYESRQHPICMTLWWLSAVLLLPAAIIMGVFIGWPIALVPWTIGMAIIGAKTLLWYHDRLCVTDTRLLAVRGILAVQQQTMPLKKLTDETLRIPWHSSLLAWLRIIEAEYATIVVESAGQDQALSRVLYVSRAIQLNRTILGTVLT
jgi:hypothetical protein